MSNFSNLQKLAVAMGFHGICPEFLEIMQHNPGSFSRRAVMAGLSTDVGIAAKREFFEFMKQSAEMFAPPKPFKSAEAMMNHCAEAFGWKEKS